jgi:uncharacterized protein YgiM (DUF1202 family)
MMRIPYFQILILAVLSASIGSAGEDAEMIPDAPDVTEFIPVDEEEDAEETETNGNGDSDDPRPSPPGDADGQATPPRDRGFSGTATTGVVTAAHVNVRSGPGADDYEIITTIQQGDQVRVRAESEAWYCIRYPETASVWIPVDAVAAELPGTIDPQGMRVPVEGDGVAMRVRSWNRATVVGHLEGGDMVTVTGRRGQWYKIEAPASAKAWISAKYVDLADRVELPPADKPDPGDLATATAEEPEDEEEEAVAVEPAPARTPVRPRIDYEALREQAEAEYQDYVAETEARLEEIEAEIEARKRRILLERGQRPAEIGTADGTSGRGDVIDSAITGWIEYIGYGLQRPAAYRLVKGGDVLFMLRSSKHNLRNYVNKRVAVDGQTEPAPGFEANVMIVQDLRVLDEGPYAGRDDMGTVVPLPQEPEEAPAPAEAEAEEATGSEGIDEEVDSTPAEPSAPEENPYGDDVVEEAFEED